MTGFDSYIFRKVYVIKKPIYNRLDRVYIYCDTLTGKFLLLKLAWLKLMREIKKVLVV